MTWQGFGIDSRGIASGVDRQTPKKVSGWINSPRSREKFDRVLETLGSRDTVETVVVDPRFESIMRAWPAAREKAQGRLDGTVPD